MCLFHVLVSCVCFMCFFHVFLSCVCFMCCRVFEAGVYAHVPTPQPGGVGGHHGRDDGRRRLTRGAPSGSVFRAHPLGHDRGELT